MSPDEITQRCRWAVEHNQGHPPEALPIGERLAVALVLRDKAYLTTIGYTTEQAVDRLCDEAQLSPFELTGWLNDIRTALER